MSSHKETNELKQALKVEDNTRIFPWIEFPTWSDELRRKAELFWFKWIGPNRVGYDQAVIDIGDLIDFARKKVRK